MSYSSIKRLLSMVLLVAFTAPSAFAISQDVVNTRNSMLLSGEVKLTENDNLITLSLRDSDVQQVLRMFADKAGLNIVFHSSAQGTVTLDLVDVSLEDAFKMVMKMTNLTYVIKDKTMMVVATSDAETVNLTKDKLFEIDLLFLLSTFFFR